MTNFKDDVIKYFQDKNDLAHLTQLFLYEGDYQKALEIAQNIQLDGYTGDYYDPVKVCAYFFTYATFMNEESLPFRKNIRDLFEEMKATNYANAPYTTLMESVEGKNFSENQKELFLEQAIDFYNKMFNHIVSNKFRDEYGKAATYCAIIKEIYDYLGKSKDFNRYYSTILERYHRFRALIAELKKKI